MKTILNLSTLLLMVFMLAPSCTKDEVREDTAEHLLTEIKSVQQEIAATVFSIQNISEKDLRQNRALAEDYAQKLNPLVSRYEHLLNALQRYGETDVFQEQIRQNWQQAVMAEPAKSSSARDFADGLPCLEKFLKTQDELVEDFVVEFLFNPVGAFFDFIHGFKEAIDDFYDCLGEKYSID